MAKPKVYIYSPVDESGESHRQMEDAGCELKLGDAYWSNFAAETEDISEHLDDQTYALMSVANRNKPVTRDVLLAAKNLRIVSKYTIGVDDIDVEAATDLGILVTHCPTEANWGGVAESVMGMMLTILKKFRERDTHVKNAGWRDAKLTGTYLGRRQDGYPTAYCQSAATQRLHHTTGGLSYLAVAGDGIAEAELRTSLSSAKRNARPATVMRFALRSLSALRNVLNQAVARR